MEVFMQMPGTPSEGPLTGRFSMHPALLEIKENDSFLDVVRSLYS